PPQQVAGPSEVSVETWVQIVKAQQQIYIRPDGTYDQQAFDPEADGKLEWVQWNKRRDAMLERDR
ncbi:MAG: hypothetical protein KDE62_04865, partial [Calditrichaeota bacterium]|nr:hypothetical protein [Calditrichota bacterium]